MPKTAEQLKKLFNSHLVDDYTGNNEKVSPETKEKLHALENETLRLLEESASEFMRQWRVQVGARIGMSCPEPWCECGDVCIPPGESCGGKVCRDGGLVDE